MTDHQAFFDLLDIMDNEKIVEPSRFFDMMRGTFRIANLLYLDAETRPAGLRIHRLHHTFTPSQVSVYLERNLHRIDPVYKLATGSVRPIDWIWARKRHPEGEPLFEALIENGFRTDGITLPLAAPPLHFAFLAIHADVPADDWWAYKRHHLRDFQLLANLFHASLLENDAGAKDEASDVDHPAQAALTHRETEVLGWAAAGKSYWEIATILGISERTVRFFMTNARRKLNVVSNTQAVAQAVRRSLIDMH